MPKTALSKVLSWHSLYEAWNALYKNSHPKSRNTQSSDGNSINDFAIDPDANLLKLVRDIQQKKFNFQRLRPYRIPKKNKKFRLICVPTVRDRIVQRALLKFLSNKYAKKFSNSISYGFIPGRGVKKAANQACQIRVKHPWVLKTDITSFFDQIKRADLISAIKSNIRERTLHPILIEAVNCEVDTSNKQAKKWTQELGIVEGQGIRQGLPLSPFFSNLVLKAFDTGVEKKGFQAIRYADDLIFFADSKQQCLEIFEYCKSELAQLGLLIPSIGINSKTEIFGPEENADFLGLGICPVNKKYELRLMPEQIIAIKTELMQLGDLQQLLSRKILLPSLGSFLRARISGYISAYDMCTNIKELENEMEGLHNKILRRIYETGLQIPISKLDATSRSFLGI